jgi:putative membrane protein
MMSWQFLAENLPHATATLNATAIVLLVLGLVSIRRGRARQHKKWMLWALGVSGLFLILYLFHKLALFQATGEPNKRFPTDPAIASDTARYTYYVILLTHLLLAMAVPFLALRAVFLAMKGRIIAHKRLVRYAYPIWMYVSVTGVLVYLMLYQIYAV